MPDLLIVQPFPDPSRGKWKISTNGGCCPRWKRDGNELHYTNADRHIVAVPVKSSPDLSLGEGVTLGVKVDGAVRPYRYDVAADGQRFLLAGSPQPPVDNPNRGQPIKVILNWAAALKH